MFEQKSCFAPKMLNKSLWKGLNKSLISQPKCSDTILALHTKCSPTVHAGIIWRTVRGYVLNLLVIGACTGNAPGSWPTSHAWYGMQWTIDLDRHHDLPVWGKLNLYSVNLLKMKHHQYEAGTRKKRLASPAYSRCCPSVTHFLHMWHVQVSICIL